MKRRRFRPRPKHTPGKLNKTEERVAQWLDRHPDMVKWQFEAHKLKIADRCWYTPDFWVMWKDGTCTFYDAKAVKKDGRLLYEDDALVKMKACAVLHDEYAFVMIGIAKDGSARLKEINP